jgi:penicillin-binding protein 1A
MLLKLGKTFTHLFYLGGIAVISLLAILLGIVWFYVKDLPDYKELANYSPKIVTRIYASDGKLVEEYAKEHRLFVPISSISKNLIYAFLAAEDKNFYTHPGLDYQGLLRAILYNLKNVGQKNLVGGSTITQQVVKNFLLNNEKSLVRKIKEAVLAIRISKVYSKDQILELYLNQIYLGAKSYGVASAAVNYFNKSIDDLTIEESALLAALPQAPSHLDPNKNPERAKIRRDWVIHRMVKEGFLTFEEAEKAVQIPIKLRKKTEEEVVKAKFFAEETRKQLFEMYGEEILYGGGLVVSTTLDSKLQAIADQALQEGLIKYDRKHGYHGKIGYIENREGFAEELKKIDIKGLRPSWEIGVVTGFGGDRIEVLLKNSNKMGIIVSTDSSWALRGKKVQEIFKIGDVIIVNKKKDNQFTLEQIPEVGGAIIVMNPHDGTVKAMSGGWDFNYSKFNRATQAMRQPGSAFKPFVYLAALENGLTPSTVLVDEPIQISQGQYLPLWEPQNFSKDFVGPLTLRAALEQSRNIVTIKLMQELGVNKIVEITKRFGIDSAPQANLSLSLGAAETTPLKMATAYSMIVNGGRKIEASLIDRIQDKNGLTILKRDKRECKECIVNESDNHQEITPPVLLQESEVVTDERSAYQIISILEGAITRGTAKKAASLKRILAGKTGTTNDSNDTWFVGFTPDLVVVVYVGFDKPKSLGVHETGASTALPICMLFFQEALKDIPDVPFRIPQGIKLVKVDYKTGLPLSTSKDYIYEAFKIGTEPTAKEIEPTEEDELRNLDNIKFDSETIY